MKQKNLEPVKWFEVFICKDILLLGKHVGCDMIVRIFKNVDFYKLCGIFEKLFTFRAKMSKVYFLAAV